MALVKRNKSNNMTSIHEVNYAKLMCVVPQVLELALMQKMRLKINNEKIIVCIEECTKFTTSLSFFTQHGSTLKWLPGVFIQARMYHDAKVAEVVNFQQNKRFNSRYDYPNKKMHQPNEKQQINYFLGEWLDHCIEHRYILRLSNEQLGV